VLLVYLTGSDATDSVLVMKKGNGLENGGGDEKKHVFFHLQYRQ
jgi:hypothetical protein